MGKSTITSTTRSRPRNKMNGHTPSDHAMNSRKKNHYIRENRRKNQKNISRLFEHLRKEQAIINQSLSNTSICQNDNSSGFRIYDDSFRQQGTSQQDCLTRVPETINLSDSLNQTVLTVIDLDCAEKKSLKRTLERDSLIETIELDDHKKPKRESNASFIVINDEDDTKQNNNTVRYATPSKSFNKNNQIHSSTPISNKKHSKDSNLPNLSIVPGNDQVQDLTKEINASSYLTIDLTTETKTDATVIDLVDSTDNPVNRTDADCSFVSISNASLTLSNESEVTVVENLRMKEREQNSRLKKFTDKLGRLNESQKGRILEFITKEVFNGCDLGESSKNIKPTRSDTPENTYIKETILGQTQSRNSIGSNIYNPLKDHKNKTGLRMIIIDGSNVAMQHGKGKVFSVVGLKICIDYFLKRGHNVKAFVPRFRNKFGKSTAPSLLNALAAEGLVLFTPSREIQGRCIASYDDRYIVQTAAEYDGVIVSGDNYRDLLLENPRWRHVIENRLLPFTWVDNLLIFPRDPLGRNGPTLEEFLKHPEPK